MFPETIETGRLTLTRFCQSNMGTFALYSLFADGEESAVGVFEYVPQEPYAAVNDAHDQLAEAKAKWNEHNAAQYAVYTPAGDLTGYAVLSIDWDRRTGTLGFILAKPFWGQGYAGECAMALTELAFDRLDLDIVAIGYEEGNKRSKRAVEKYIGTVGGEYDGILRNWTPTGDDIADHYRYTVTREQYRRTGC